MGEMKKHLQNGRAQPRKREEYRGSGDNLSATRTNSVKAVGNSREVGVGSTKVVRNREIQK